MSKKTVFIIDDEVDFVLPLKDKLEASGYHVHEFYDGATALDALNRYKPDLILLDIIMPKINGYQVAMKIRDNEDFENVLTDIILGAIGSAVAIFFLPDIISKQNIYLVLSLCIITNLICLFFGWKNYLKKKSSQSSSHGYILYTLYFIYIFGILIAVVSFYYWLTNFFP